MRFSCQIIDHTMHENMNFLTLFAPFILVLSISTALAQESTIPDRERLQSMSHEEYDAYRAQMRDRMDVLNPEERNLTGINEREQMEKRDANSRYGQGYVSRNRPNTLRSGSGVNTGNQQSGAYGRGSAGRR